MSNGFGSFIGNLGNCAAILEEIVIGFQWILLNCVAFLMNYIELSSRTLSCLEFYRIMLNSTQFC